MPFILCILSRFIATCINNKRFGKKSKPDGSVGVIKKIGWYLKPIQFLPKIHKGMTGFDSSCKLAGIDLIKQITPKVISLFGNTVQAAA